MIVSPYGMRDARQAADGLFHVGSPRSIESARMSAFVSPASMSGLLAPSSFTARCPGPIVPDVVLVRCLENAGKAERLRDGEKLRENRRLAVIAPVGRIAAEARHLHHVIRANDEVLHPERAGERPRTLDFRGRHRRKRDRDCEQLLPENAARDAQEKGRIDPSRERDEGAAAPFDDLLETSELRGPVSPGLASWRALSRAPFRPLDSTSLHSVSYPSTILRTVSPSCARRASS